jgi:hypothetical protein
VDDDVASSEQGGADIRADPMDAILRCPAVDEKAHVQQVGSQDHQRNTKFWLANIVVAPLEGAINCVVERCRGLSSDPEADTEADVIETADSNPFMILNCPERWKCGEQQIHQPVVVEIPNCKDQSNHTMNGELLTGQHLDDGLRAQKANGPLECCFDHMKDIAILEFKLSVVFGIPLFFANLAGLAMQQDRSIGFCNC